jgi:hypothetical protein
MNGNHNKHGPFLLIWFEQRWPLLVRIRCSWLFRKLKLPRIGTRPHMKVDLRRIPYVRRSRAGPLKLPRDWILGIARSAITRMPRDWINGLPRDGTVKLARDCVLNMPRDGTLTIGRIFRYALGSASQVYYQIRGKTRFRWRRFLRLNRYFKPVMGEVHPVGS